MKKTLSIRTGAPPAGNARPDASTWGASGIRLERLKERAREQRRNPTEAQELLWEHLSGARLGGMKFTRQAVVGSVIVDFACASRWLVVAISGADANPEIDALQDRKLTDIGIRVLRFPEDRITGDTDGVVAVIAAELNKPFDKRAMQSNFSTAAREPS